jgi:hypothetical protein
MLSIPATQALLGSANTWTATQAFRSITVTPTTITGIRVNAPSAPTGGASAFVSRIDAPSGTIAFATSPQTGDFAGVSLGQSTLTNPSAGTVPSAATLKIDGAPIASTNVTITNRYALWLSGTGAVTAGIRIDAGSSTAISIAGAASGIAIGTGVISRFERIRLAGNYSTDGSASVHTIGIKQDAATVTYTAVAQTNNVHGHLFDQITFTSAVAGTIPVAATLKIVGAPISAGSVTITTAYALWVPAGNCQFGGSVTFDGSVFLNNGATLADARNIAVGTTTGTKIGTATTQKLAFYNATPIVQPAGVADASGGAVIDTQARAAINAVIANLEALGLQAVA